MSILDFFRKRPTNSSATMARDRLQVIIAREGHGGANSELVQQIKQAVMEAISRFVNVSPNDISVERSQQNNLDMLSVSFSLPEDFSTTARKPLQKAGQVRPS